MNPAQKNSAQVTAIVPARNEEGVIATCVESLAVQPEIGEILVVDDQSEDRTAAIVKQEMEKISKLRLLGTKKLPAGWVGKNYAVSVGAREATTEWLLFTDADAVHSADSAEKALKIAAAEQVAMVSFSPEQVMETWYERALIPYVYCRLASRFSYREVNDPTKSAAAANGQFLMIRRDVYQTIGGHAGVAGEVLEDVALARRVKAAGYRIWFGSGKGIVRARMYRSFDAMWEGWTKNLYPLMGRSLGTLARECVLALAPVPAILIVSVFAFLFTKSQMFAFAVFALALLVESFGYAKKLTRCGFSPWLALYGIPGGLMFAGVLFASFQGYRRGWVQWKGREYPAGTPRASK